MPRERASFASTEPPRWAASKSSPENIASASFPILPTKGPLARHMKRHVLRTQATVRLTVEPKAPSPDADEPAAPRGSVASLLKRRSSSVSSLLTRERERLKLEETMREYEAMRSRASAALHLGDWSAAEEALSEQIKLQDRSAVLFNSRSYVNLKLDRPEQSLADADMAVSLEPHSPIGHYRRAQALSRTYRTQEAGSALIKSMDYSGGDGAATDDGGFVNLPDWADVERSVAYGVPIEGRKAPTGDGPDVARFGDVLGRIRRNRRFSSLSSVSPNSSITSPGVATRLPAIGHKRTGHGLGPSRLGDDHVSQLVAPSQVPLPVASAVGMRCMTVQWQEPTSLDEEIDGYTLEYTEASLHEARKPTPEEAVDDGRASDAPVASAGTNAGAELDWRVAYHGPAHSFELVELETDSEYLVRVAAFNCAGVGEWSPQLRVTTLAIEEDRAEAEIPDKWLGLRKHLDSELGQDSAFRSREGHWDAIVAAFQKHQRSIRIAFRLNALYGEFLPREKAKGTGAAAAGVAATPSSSDEDATIASKPAPADAPDAFCLTTEGSINSIDHHQYRTFLSDCSINAAGKGGKAVSSHAATEIFEHVSASEIDDAVAAPIAKGFLGTSAEAASRVREDVRLSLHEFVHALVLLGQARYGGTSGSKLHPMPWSCSSYLVPCRTGVRRQRPPLHLCQKRPTHQPTRHACVHSRLR